MRPADENSEEILIERLKNQEERALEELVEIYEAEVFQVQDYDVVEMPDLFEKAEQEERQRFVQEALNRLSEEEKEIFIRYYYFYQTTEEIGDAMGIRQNTVKSKLKRGRKKLKGFLMERGMEP